MLERFLRTLLTTAVFGGAIVACSTGGGTSSAGGGKQVARTTDLFLESSHPLEGTVDFLDVKNGFRDLHFGDAPTAAMKLAEKQDTDLTQSYVREGDDMNIGGAPVTELRYVFHDGGLVSVVIATADEDASRAVLEQLWDAYGPTQPGQAPGHAWRGKKVVVGYARDKDGVAAISIWHQDLMKPVVAKSRARAGE